MREREENKKRPQYIYLMNKRMTVMTRQRRDRPRPRLTAPSFLIASDTATGVFFLEAVDDDMIVCDAVCRYYGTPTAL